MRQNHIKFFEEISNLFEFLAIVFILLIALAIQIFLKELPCPLCLLQRIGFIGIAYGLLLNFRFGFRPSHYAIALLSGIFTSLVALRQIILHVVPGTGAYGSSFLGLHLYTWSFIISILIVIGTILLLAIDRQYFVHRQMTLAKKRMMHILFGMIILIVFSNIITVAMECGLGACPENPTHYRLVKV